MWEQLARERVALKKIREKCRGTDFPGVSIIISTNKLKYRDNMFSNFKRLQYNQKELIVILNSSRLDINDYKARFAYLPNVRIYKKDENHTLGECLNFGIEQSRYKFISKIDDDDYYGDNYLTDLINVFKYTDAEVVGKLSAFVYFENGNILTVSCPEEINKHVGWVNGGTLLIKKEVFNKVKFRERNIGEDSKFFVDCDTAGIRIYTADKFNYVIMRHKDLNDHTWRMSEDELMPKCEKLITTTRFIPIITV